MRALFRVFGASIITLAVFTVLEMAYPKYGLGTWTQISTGESASFFAKLVDLLVYWVGVPSVFFIMILFSVAGFRLLFGMVGRHPEIKVMLGFISISSLSASMALLIPDMLMGGVFGNFVALDAALLPSGVDIVLGTVFFAIFIWLGGLVLNIKLNNLIKLFHNVGQVIEWPIARLIRIRPRVRIRVTNKYKFDPVGKMARKAVTRVKKHPPRRKTKTRCAVLEDDEIDIQEFELPMPELLEKSNFANNVVTREHKDIAESMEINFAKYGIKGRVREIHPGPIVTRYDFEPDDGQKIAKIIETANDMRRAMATEQIRIALVPRTRYIGVEMVNPNRQFVYYQTLIASPEFTESKMSIPLALGVEISGRPFYADLARMPHVLIAGRTGSGKSVFVQSIITSIVYHAKPDEIKLVIVDPKGVDFNKWKDIPHLITPIVTDASAAVNVLKWSVREMEDRYKKLQSVEAQNIADYNSLVDKMNAKGKTIKKKVPVGTNEDGEIEYEMREVAMEKMPYVVLIMDEIADLMQQARKEVEACVQRITQKARASGIHLVAATQRPDTSVITGVIKSNLPTRISFQARSYIDSMTTLGERGAEMLLAQGDMLYSESGKQPIRIHGAFVSDREIDKIAKFLRTQQTAEYAEGVQQAAEEMNSAMLGLPPSASESADDLYKQAVETVLRDKKPTISYIQRRLGIGYNKAATLIEKMEADGLIVKTTAGKYEVA